MFSQVCSRASLQRLDIPRYSQSGVFCCLWLLTSLFSWEVAFLLQICKVATVFDLMLKVSFRAAWDMLLLQKFHYWGSKEQTDRSFDVFLGANGKIWASATHARPPRQQVLGKWVASFTQKMSLWYCYSAVPLLAFQIERQVAAAWLQPIWCCTHQGSTHSKPVALWRVNQIPNWQT